MRAVGRLGQGAGVLAHGVAREPELAGDLTQGEALDPGVLHRFPERQLPRGQLPACRHGGKRIIPPNWSRYLHPHHHSLNKQNALR